MAIKTSKGRENYFALYKSSKRYEANRKLKLQRQLKLQPNNENLRTALSAIRPCRKTPNSPQWSHTDIRQAKLFKEFTGRANPDLFSKNPKVQQSALQNCSRQVFPKWVMTMPKFIDFSIGAQVLAKAGA